jgi:adenylate cyclase
LLQGWEISLAELSSSHALRIAALGHRIISPKTRDAVARAVKHILVSVREGALRPDGPDLVVISPLAQGADQIIAGAGLALGYQLQAILPGPQSDYERTFDLGETDEEIAIFRGLLDHARQGHGAEELEGDLRHEVSRNRAFLDCADRMIRKSDMVLAILSADRWESHTGQSARAAIALGLPLLVIDPAMPDRPLLYRKEAVTAATAAIITQTVRELIDRRFPDDLAGAKSALAAGDFLTAIDLLRHAPDEPDMLRRVERDYLLVLALARAGAAKLGLERFGERLAGVPLDGLPADMARDIAALQARCLKDLALETPAPRAALIEAAGAYEAVYRRFGGYYPLINAATLFLLAGEQATAEDLARQTLREVADSKDYWGLATKAEALLVLGQSQQVGAVLEAAGAQGVPPSNLASTKKQLLAVCAARGLPVSLLEGLRIPSVVYYCGHQTLAEQDAARLPQEIAAQLRRLNAGFAFGSLASGGDILLAEAALEAGLELHVVLPYRAEDFIRSSVAPGWEARFGACMARARTVSFVIDNDVLAHDCVYALCGSQAMGMARRHADALAAGICQLAVWDGLPARAVATTAAGVAQWSGLGLASIIVPPRGEPYRLAAAPPPPAGGINQDVVPRSFLFADVRGFSKLPERNMEVFVAAYLGALAEAIGRFAGDIDYRATAGDGVFLVFRTPARAAECAIAMQQQSQSFDHARHGIAVDLQLRIAIHHGPAHPVRDPILNKASFAGREIIRAARIEPVTPPGEIYVTEQLASALFLTGAKAWRCDYVGIQPAAKGFGNFRMYSIKPRGEPLVAA